MIVALARNKMRKSNNKFPKQLTAIDLFSGAGGLTVGLKKAGIKVLAAVEIDSEIAKTYKANHPEVCVLSEDIRKLSGADLVKKLKSKVDIVAGCPPCQGFSKLTDKYHRSDVRNRLVYEMARMVEELRPRVCMMENVAGLAGRGMPLLKRFEKRLRDMGYVITKGVLQMADYGVPQSRQRLVLLAGLGFEIPLPSPTHASLPKSKSGLKKWKTVRQAISANPTPTKLWTAPCLVDSLSPFLCRA
jgi:DNA (cytosine-5)-methyltransferase 1